MAEILREIEAAYAGILNKPFTGYYNGEHVFADTTGRSRFVICFKGDDVFRGLVNEAIQRVNEIERRHNIAIWKGVISDWMYNLYIAPVPEVSEATFQGGNTFVIYRVEAVQINPMGVIRWPFVCNLYVKAHFN